MIVVGFHLWHGVSSAFQSLGVDTRAGRRVIRAAGKTLAVVIAGGFIVIAVWVVSRRGPVMTLDAKVPGRPAGRQVGPAQVRDEAGQPGQQAQVHRSSSSAPAWPARRRPRRSASSATTSCASASRTARAARTASPRRAASTPRRTTRTTATASTACSTTRSRAATTARAKPTSTGSRSCQRQHHRPVRRAGRAVRARVRRPARQPLVRRRAGVAHVLRARPDRPAAAARRLPGADAAGARQARCTMFPRREMLDLVVVDGKARGIVVRNLITGEIERYAGDAVVLATGGYGTVYYLSTNAVNSNVTAAWRAHKRGALFANPCFTQIHPTCIPVSGDHQSKLTLMSESAAQRRPRLGAEDERRQAAAGADSRGRARLLPRAQVPELRQPRAARRRVAQREGRSATRAAASARAGLAVYLDFADAIKRLGADDDQGAVRQPVRHVPADHRRGSVQGADAHLPRHPLHDGRPVGGLQPDEHDPGPARARRSELLRPRREPPRRERADAGAGRRLLRHPVHDRRLPREHRAAEGRRPITTRSRRPRRRRRARIDTAAVGQGQPQRSASSTASSARILWDDVGMARTEAGLQTRARARFRSCATSSGRTSSVPGDARQPEPEPRVRRPRRRLPRVRASCSRSTRCTARNRAAATSARRARRPTAKRCATTSTSRTSRPGNSRASASRRCCTRSRSCSRKCIRRSGATSRLGLQAWAIGIRRQRMSQHGLSREPKPVADRITMRLNSENLAAGRARRAPGGSSTTRPTTSRPTCRSSRCSTSSTKG